MIRAYDDPSNPRRNEYAAQPQAQKAPTDEEVLAYIKSLPGGRMTLPDMLKYDREAAMRHARHQMASRRSGAAPGEAAAMRPARGPAGQEFARLPNGVAVPTYRRVPRETLAPQAAPADDLNDPESPANQPSIADASGAFYQVYNDAWRQLRSQYPAWGRDQLRQAATKVAMESTKEQNRAFDSMMRPVEQPRPPQPTDPLRKLIEDARKQMDMQDQVNMVRKQVEQEALQRRAMQTGERVMWENNRPFLPSDNPEAAKRVSDANMQKQIADQQEAFRKQQAREQQMRERAKPPRFVPGMAQPKAPPSDGTPYGEPDPYWGSRIGRDGPMSADFRDTDGDGTDDRYQLPPGQRGAQPHRRQDMFDADAALAQAQMEERHRQMQANPPRPGSPSSFRRLF